MAIFRSDCLSSKICIWDQIQAYDIMYLLYSSIYIHLLSIALHIKKNLSHFKILKHFSVSVQVPCQSYRSSDDGKFLGDSTRESHPLAVCSATTVVFLFAGNALCYSAFSAYSAWTSVLFTELRQALGYDLPCVCKRSSSNYTSVNSHWIPLDAAFCPGHKWWHFPHLFGKISFKWTLKRWLRKKNHL